MCTFAQKGQIMDLSTIIKHAFLYYGFIITDSKYNVVVSNNMGKFNNPTLSNSSNLIERYPSIESMKVHSIERLPMLQRNDVYLSKFQLPLKNETLYLFNFFDYSAIAKLHSQLTVISEQNIIYKKMLSKLKDGIFITNHYGKNIYFNDAFLTLSGLTSEQITGKTVYSLLSEGTVPNSCVAKVLETGKDASTVTDYNTGKKCLVSGYPVNDSKGELKNVLTVIRDISEVEMLVEKLAVEKNMSMSYKHEIDKLEKKEIYKEFTITRSKRMEDIYDQVSKVADFNSPILIGGETGVGKDFLASYIHNISRFSDTGVFVKINCAAIPDNLLESELFGYEKGAFSGAQNTGKIGLFEKGNNGTIFLDEIGEMPVHLQSKLLNALNDKEFLKLGGSSPIKFNARIISATNADLDNLIKEKKFRLDLYYRLNVITLSIPPLRERKEDILPLAMLFLEQYNNNYKRNCYFSPNLLENFINYQWIGNIRELKNTIERLVLISNNDCLDQELFQIHIKRENHENFNLLPSSNQKDGLKDKLESYEKFIIENAIKSNKTLDDAAKELDIDISTLVRKKKKYGIFKRKSSRR